METPLQPCNESDEISQEVNEEDQLENMKRDGLTVSNVIAYSVSHFNNDLSASMWFVYLTWYLS